MSRYVRTIGEVILSLIGIAILALSVWSCANRPAESPAGQEVAP
jgi:hypothetical protein